MLTKPLVLKIWPFLFALIALAMPVQLMLIYGHGFSEMSSVINKLTILNWMVMGGLLVCAFGIYEVKPWTRNALFALMGLVVINNFCVAYVGADYSFLTVTLSTLIFLALNVPLIRKDMQVVFAQPEKQWWRVAVRKEVHVPVKLSYKQTSFKTETFNISTSGIFVPLSLEEIKTLQVMRTESTLQICLVFSPVAQFRCTGRMTRWTEANGKYPVGVGIQFINLSADQTDDLRRHLRRKEPVLQLQNLREL